MPPRQTPSPHSAPYQNTPQRAASPQAEAGRHPDAFFPPLPSQPDLPAIERDILKRWRDDAIFERSLAQTAAGPWWTFYEGPPTTNGMPGVHHVEARVFKDLFLR